MLEKKKFVKYDPFGKPVKAETISLKLNLEEREILNKCKMILEQTKDGTALKSLAWIGAKVIQEEKTQYILATLFKNKRNNNRLGIMDFE